MKKQTDRIIIYKFIKKLIICYFIGSLAISYCKRNIYKPDRQNMLTGPNE